MAVFEYKGFDGGGKAIAGVIDADAARNARSKLRSQGLFPTEIYEQQAGAGATKGEGLGVQVDFSKYLERISVQDISTMTQQLSTLVGANIPMVEALTAMIDQVEKPKLRIILADVRDKVKEGSTLADAMKPHGDVFDDLYVNMVRAGEASGALETVLERLAEHTEATVRLRGKLIAAMIYPVLMSLVGVAIVMGLFVFIIPKIRRVFESFDAELPWITEFLLGLSDFMVSFWWLLGLIGAGAAFFFRRWKKTEAGARSFDAIILRMPVFGRINRTVAVARFCRTLATLMNSGVPILNAMRITSTVVQNHVLADAIDEAARNVTEGQSLAAPLKASGQFPPLVTHMIAIGERTGELEGMLGKVADAYEAEVETSVETLTSLLEPILILVMGGVVAFVALAILLPMLNLSSLAG